MALEIIVVKNDYTVGSGLSAILQAVVRGWTDKKEQKMLWAAEKGNVDANGRYTAPEIVEDTDDQVTVVCAEDSSVRQVFNINIKGKKEKVKTFAKEMEVDEAGAEGKYHLNIQITNDKAVGHKCVLVITEASPERCILPGRPTSKQIDVPTDDNGFLSIKLFPFKERKRTFFICVKGVKDLRKKTVVWGPKKEVKLDPKAGFWKNFTQKF
jgi:hypothetical protein